MVFDAGVVFDGFRFAQLNDVTDGRRVVVGEAEADRLGQRFLELVLAGAKPPGGSKP